MNPPPLTPAPSANATSRRALIVTAALLSGFSLLILIGGGFGFSPGTAHTDDAYVNFVRKHFIKTGRLVVRQGVDANAGVPIVDLAPEIYAGADPVAWRYANESFLLDDIRRNNPSIWTIENGQVTDINPGAHSTPPPFRDKRSWHGVLLYRAALAARPDLDIVLQPRGWAGPVVRLPPGAGGLTTGDSSIRRLVLTTTPQPTEIRAIAVDIYCRNSDPLPTVKIRRIGDQTAVSADPSTSCGVGFGSDRLDRPRFDALGRGDRISVLPRAGRVYSWERVAPLSGERALSSPTPGGERTRDPDTYWWSAAFERDYLGSLPIGPGGNLQDDVRTSLDPFMQHQAQGMLDAFLLEHPSASPVDAQVSAVTIMDARTGEVLAMATAPRASSDAGPLLDRDDAIGRSSRLNQNLELLPIGSAAKPLIAAGILAERPDLVGLQVPGQLEIADLMGLPFSSTLKNSHIAARWINFDTFIQHSDNIYAASLLLLGSSDRGRETCRLRKGEQYRLDDQTREVRPKSVFEAVGADGFCVPHAPESKRQLRWADRLSELFDVNISDHGPNDGRSDFAHCAAGGGRYGDDVRDSTVWRRLFQTRPGLRPCGFREASPAREALAIDSAHDFRRELLTVMLGNGEGRWTAVKTAEAYARLVTGRRVRAAFTAGPEESFAPLDPNFRARIALTHALTLVPSGTARETELPMALHDLQAKLSSQGLILGAFGKTGTPVAVKVDYRPVDKAINLLIARQRLRYASTVHGLILTSEGRHVTLNSDRKRADTQLAVRMLSSDRVMAEARQRFGVQPSSVVAALGGYVRRMAVGDQPFIMAQNTMLVRVGARRDDGGDETDADTLHGKVMALVVCAYDPRIPPALGRPAVTVGPDGRAWDGASRPLRAYAVVVNLQYPVRDRANAAADLSARIVRDLLAVQLTTGRPPW